MPADQPMCASDLPEDENPECDEGRAFLRNLYVEDDNGVKVGPKAGPTQGPTTGPATSYDPAVSLFRSAVDPKPAGDAPLSAVVARIRSPELAEVTAKIKTTYGTTMAKALAEGASKADATKAAKKAIVEMKKTLPAVTLAGTFDRRRANEAWKAPSSLVPIDLDALGEGLDDAWEVLTACPWVELCLHSPSGDGLKGAVRVPAMALPDPARYRVVWQAVTDWLASLDLDNDRQGKDPARLAFLAHDLNCYHNADAVVFPLDDWAEVGRPQPDGSPPKTEARPNGSDVVGRARRYLAAIPPAIEGKKGDPATYGAAVAIAWGFDLDVETALGLLLADYNPRCLPPWPEKDIRRKVENALKESHLRPRGWLRDAVRPGRNGEEAPKADRRADDHPSQEGGTDGRTEDADGRSDAEGQPAIEALPVRDHALRVAASLRVAQWVVEDLLEAGDLGALVAQPGQGKTLAASEMTRGVATGGFFAGRRCRLGRVLYVCTDSPASAERRMVAFGEEAGNQIHTLIDLDLPADFPRLKAYCAVYHPQLIVLDTWDSTRTHRGEGGWQSVDADLEGLMRPLRQLATEETLAALIVHHATRMEAGRPRGSIVFDARMEFIGVVSQPEEGMVDVEATKLRDGEKGCLGRWRIVAVDVGGRKVPTLDWMGKAKEEPMGNLDVQMRVLRAVSGQPPAGGWTYAKLAEHLGMSKGQQLTDAVKTLRQRGAMKLWTAVETG